MARQFIATSFVVCAGLAGSLAGARWAEAVLASASVVSCALLLALFRLAHKEREQAMELILMGCTNGNVPAMARQLARLDAPRTQTGLRRAFAAMLRECQATPHLRPPAARPLYDVRVVREAALEMAAVHAALSDGRRPAQGLARAERLIARGVSPLYGSDPDALRAELRDILVVMNRGAATPSAVTPQPYAARPGLVRGPSPARPTRAQDERPGSRERA